MDTDLEKILSSANKARLIPTLPDSKKEEKATSCLLSTFMVVPEFARQVLSDAGAPVGKRIHIECYTEVVFKSSESGKNSRPDGLIVIKGGSKTWVALVESKIANNQLSQEQVEEYIDLARRHGIDSVITISNQFATIPTHHPIKINKKKLRSVQLFHFSWLSLVSKAILISDNKVLEDAEQSFILNELVQYLNHESSGVSALAKMHSDWKESCTNIQQGVALSKNSDIVRNTVSSWHQLQRHLSLKLSMSIGSQVTIHLNRQRANDAELNLQEDCATLSHKNQLDTDFVVKNAASNLHFCADFSRRTVTVSMKLEAPKDKSRATAPINWLTRQLKEVETELTYIRVHWPGRILMTSATLQEAIDDPIVLLPPGEKVLPSYMEVARVIDLAGKFKGARTFVEISWNELESFYRDVGQHLSKWIPKAPKIKDPEKEGENISLSIGDSITPDPVISDYSGSSIKEN